MTLPATRRRWSAGPDVPCEPRAAVSAHHRLKTFTAWTYRRLSDGDYEWTDPYAHLHVVTPGC